MSLDTFLLAAAAICFGWNAVAQKSLLAAGLLFWVLTQIF